MLTIPLHLGSKPWRFVPFAWSLRLTGLSERCNDTPQISRKRHATRGDRCSLRSECRELRLTGKRLDVWMSLAYGAIGFSPITALALAIIGVLPLSLTTLLFVLPATVLGIVLAVRFPAYGKLALKGLLIGLIAVFLYDCFRAPFIIAGVWGDFIPKINMWLFNTSQPNWVVGYVWRYLGDGGFLGMAFTVGYCRLKPHLSARIAALGFGFAIWVCLVLTLVLAPHGQEALFKLTPTILCLSLLGHLIYGMTIGMLLPRVCRDQSTGAEPGKTRIALPQGIWEEGIKEEMTVKLPVGDLLASWLTVRTRLTSFAVLRALGAAPWQVAGVLTWEQAVVYATALFLGVIFGGVLSLTVVPAQVFTGVPTSGVLSSLSSDEFYVLQHVIPAQIVAPLSLGLVFIVLVCICVVALGMMARVVLQPSMSQTLRLNED